MSTFLNLIYNCFVLHSIALPVHTECLKNVHFNEVLFNNADFQTHDNDRRHIVTSPLDQVANDNGKVWSLVPHGKYYQIINNATREHLYAAADDLKYDPERRQVFTWIPNWDNDADRQGLWDLEQKGMTEGYIRNVEFNEYLYAADGIDLTGSDGIKRKRLFTWLSSSRNVGSQGVWHLSPDCAMAIDRRNG